MTLEECEGYKSLAAAVEKDTSTGTSHDYRAKFNWVLSRAQHYAEKTGLDPADILNAWERGRTYWYMNYYQECNQPEIKADSVRVFDTVEALRESIGTGGFVCPHCEQISRSPYECDSGAIVGEKPCDWKVYGLFGHMGKGTSVFVKEKMQGQAIFMPVAWSLADTAR